LFDFVLKDNLILCHVHLFFNISNYVDSMNFLVYSNFGYAIRILNYFYFSFILSKVNIDYIRQAKVMNIHNLIL